ncbi:MAG: glycosyltransferase, partial [Candidatus Omnitrophica bacterium]|nr:glycosyltransferase [Candidatus Omnitrophota bacterium]
PKVSVIIPSYNYGQFLGEALTSVLNQSFQDYEVLVMDDGSTDQSADVVQSFSTAFAGRLKYFYQDNQGVAASRNNGILKSQGQYIAFLDADDVWLEGTLEKLLAALQAHPECGLVYGNVEIYDVSMKNLIKVRFGADSREIPFSGYCVDKLFLFGNFIPMDAMMVDRSVFDRVGLFDKRFKCGEDLDMWMRIASQFAIIYIDEILTKLRRHEASLSFSFINSAKADVLMTHKLLKRMPAFRKKIGEQKIKEKFYQAFYGLGIFSILEGRRRRGRAWLKKAWNISANPWRNKIVLYFFLSYLPLSFFANEIRNALHAFRTKSW